MLQSIIQIVSVIIAGYSLAILVNYLSDVLPIYRKFGIPLCRNCGASLPLSHYLLPNECCNSCGTRQPIRNWIVTLFFILSSIYLWSFPPEKFGYIISLIILTYFGVIAIIDIEHRVVLHPTCIFGAIIGLIIGYQVNGLQNTLIGCIAGFGIMLALYYLGMLFLYIRSKKQTHQEEIEEALGFGDVNLAGILGLYLGWPSILVSILMTIFAAGLFSFFYILIMITRKQYTPNMAIPYGPFLLFGASVLLFT